MYHAVRWPVHNKSSREIDVSIHETQQSTLPQHDEARPGL